MLIAIAEFVVRPGAENEFQTTLEAMQRRVKSIEGYLGEEPCQSLTDQGKLVTISYWRDAAEAHRLIARNKVIGNIALLPWAA